ncbi:aminotransferase-like domain-containing protein [Allosphingosinicella deserti]|uniref:GntR family transcriptional regulator n=1 Tax=Allosphingosinicella deserti TaxID=2116704 RepID=A0A2P7QUM3_9SPHN|nr:PLP-dependent aminotransferase family protein [Sphingomonas deserti]PSJ41668.1 GntR family transcriptional regulator [Sphingomonas deserti]
MVSSPVRTASKVTQVMEVIRHRVDRRLLTPGARIPSVRAMAGALIVSKSTVVEAYDRLAAEGLVEGRPGSGFYVAAPLAPLRLLSAEADTDPTADPLWTMRQSLRPAGTALRPGCGWLPDSWMPEDALRRALRSLARDGSGATLFEYGPPQGDETLRTLIARRMAEQGVDVAPEQVLLTDSGSHAIDLICRFLLESGDTVLVDDPCYFNFHTVLRAHRAKVIGVPYTPTGPDLTAFRTAVEAHRPRLYITNAALHNPTGATLSAAAAHRVLRIAESHDMVIVEDDIFGDFESEPAPRLAAFDGLDRVIRIGSFSKTLSAAVRCGHIAARNDWIADLTDLRLATGMASSPLSAALLVSVLTDGSYRRHVERLRVQLARRRGRVLDRLGRLGIEAWHVPTAGMFLWCRLPEGSDSAEVARRALADDVVLAPGNAFSVSGNAARFMRFNIAQMDDVRVDATLARVITS